MSNQKHAIGVDFGTESGRAVLVNVADGQELAAAVHPYANGVIDEVLPGSEVRLEPDWALQDPNDYLEVFKHAIPAVLAKSGVAAEDVIGLESATTLQGAPISISVQDGSVFLNDAVQVVAPDIIASNGVIHVIDGVLLPPQ